MATNFYDRRFMQPGFGNTASVSDYMTMLAMAQLPMQKASNAIYGMGSKPSQSQAEEAVYKNNQKGLIMVKATVKAYLAHTFKHRKFIKDVLTARINAVGIQTRNPFYEPDGTTKRKEVKFADEMEINGSTSDIAKESLTDVDKEKRIRMIRRNSKKIITRDLGFIDRTDLTIAYMTDISAGTTSEIFYTGVIKRRPVYLLSDRPEVYEHPWLIYACKHGKICKTIEELIKTLEKKYG
jgi:hypothetical protein